MVARHTYRPKGIDERVPPEDRERANPDLAACQLDLDLPGCPPSILAAISIARVSRARPVGSARDHRPAATKHAAPRPAPAVKPTIAGQVRCARRRAPATSAGLFPSSTSPTSIMKRVMLVVITAVGGAPFSEVCTNAFCTAIAETPSMPARIAFAAFGATGGPAATPTAATAGDSCRCSC
jgi:hypothetical protein